MNRCTPFENTNFTTEMTGNCIINKEYGQEGKKVGAGRGGNLAIF
jgi:hypothetical protein